MTCNLNAICFIDQHNETLGKSNFIVTANTTRDNDLERFEKASDICILNLEKDNLPKSLLSITLVGIASDNSETNDDKVILKLNTREHIDSQNNKSFSFDLYHFLEESHLLLITSKVSRGSSLYITGSLSLIDDLLLVRLTQINFIENTRSSPNKTSSYAWEKREEKESTTQSISLATEIVKSLSAKFNKRKIKNQAITLSRSQKIPKLSSLALP
ncbi:7584_t:CDS:2 [Funneliformis geosporum]|nr:7584_t:CDS:2 [Funneliformis geosporum]